MARMFLVCGTPGAGKTEFSKKFCEHNGIRYLSPDMYYACINGDERIRSNEFLVWHTLFGAILQAEAEGVDVLVDTQALRYIDRVKFLEWFPQFEHHLIYITASLELCLRNNEMRRRVIPLEKLENAFAQLEPPNEFEDERWLTVSIIKNEDNKLYLKSIYLKG